MFSMHKLPSTSDDLTSLRCLSNDSQSNFTINGLTNEGLGAKVTLRLPAGVFLRKGRPRGPAGELVAMGATWSLDAVRGSGEKWGRSRER